MTFHSRSGAAGSRRHVLVFAAFVGLALAAACTPAGTASSSPSSSAVPSAAPSTTSVLTPQQAAALVLASDSRFAGIGQKNPNSIGGCCFYEVAPAGDGFRVTVEIGWGDCPAGCINKHHWFYTVAKDGTVTFNREDGPAVPAGVTGSGGGGAGTGDAGDKVAGVRGTAVAGPTCPVVTANDPNCADRPVVGATIHVLDATGVEVAQLTTDAAGTFMVSLPPGEYQLRADPVEGLMGTPDPRSIIVGATVMGRVVLSYDTGIR